MSTAAAGPGQLAVKIKQNNTRLVHEEAELAEHVHEITFVPETTVQCTIDISFNGENNCKYTLPSTSLR